MEVKRNPGRPRKDGTPAQRRTPVPAVIKEAQQSIANGETDERFEPFQIPQPGIRKPKKEINVSILKLSGHWLHQDNEAASFQEMSPGYFSTMMKKRDPESGMTYREIFDMARGSGRATIMRRVSEYIDLKNSAGASILKFVMQNEFGWTERSQSDGTMKHRHVHRHEPPKAIEAMNEKELAEYAMGVKPNERSKLH